MNKKEYKKRKCLNCGKNLTGKHPSQKYCLTIDCQRKRKNKNMKRYFKKRRIAEKILRSKEC